MKVTNHQLFEIIREYQDMLAKDHIDGHPWSGTLEDLAHVQGKTWGGGSVVDPKGYNNIVSLAVDYTRGKAKSPLQSKRVKLNEVQLRKIIRSVILQERATLASASDVARFKPQVTEWVEVLLDELSTTSERWKKAEINEKRLENMVRSITDAVVSALIGATSGMDYSAQKKQQARDEEKSHQKWDKQRRATRGSGARYYGDYGT